MSDGFRRKRARRGYGRPVIPAPGKATPTISSLVKCVSIKKNIQSAAPRLPANEITVFPLNTLDRHLLERVFTKVSPLIILFPIRTFQLDGNSYFRLQQTCRDVKEFIQKNKNICVHLRDSRQRRWLLNLDSDLLGSFYGYRLDTLDIKEGQLNPITLSQPA